MVSCSHATFTHNTQQERDAAGKALRPPKFKTQICFDYQTGVAGCPSVWSRLLSPAPSPYINPLFRPLSSPLVVSCRWRSCR